MDIDDMSREFFELEVVSEHVNGMHFETKMQASPTKLTTIDEIDERHYDPNHERNVDSEVIATFWCIEKLIGVAALGAIYVGGLRQIYCGGSPDGGDNNNGQA